MKDKRSLQSSKNCFKIKEQAAKSTIVIDCEVPSCEDCGIYRQMTERPIFSYRAFWQKTISEKNCLLFKTIGIIAISFLASVINFSRLAEFKEEQLYLETILLTVLCYLTTSDVTKGVALLFGGLFHWYLAFRTKSKNLTVFIMTCLQAESLGIRYSEWATMIQHLYISCIAIHFTTVLKTHYISIMLYSFIAAYFSYVRNYGIYIEDLFLLTIALFSATFTVTGDPQHCFLQENMSSLTIWIVLREIRAVTAYRGLGLKV